MIPPLFSVWFTLELLFAPIPTTYFCGVFSKLGPFLSSGDRQNQLDEPDYYLEPAVLDILFALSVVPAAMVDKTSQPD